MRFHYRLHGQRYADNNPRSVPYPIGSAGLVVILLVLLSACAANRGTQHGESHAAGSSTRADTATQVTVEDAARTIQAAEMLEHITYLASDAMRGRETPSPGLNMAALYVADKFRGLGLAPGADNRRSFIQQYGFPLIALATERTKLAIQTPGGVESFRYGDEFFATPGAPAAARGRLVRVDTDRTNVWQADDALRGAVPVIMMDGSFSRAWRTTVEPARAAAREAGAEAIIFVLDRSISSGTIEQLAAFVAGPRRVLGGVDRIPAYFVRRQPALRAFEEAGIAMDGDDHGSTATHTSDGSEKGVDDASPGIRALEGLAVRLSAPVNMLDDASAPNVVAILPGSDPELRESYVVLSAHMDHVGVGRPNSTGDSIYNGADDNASGTSALIEIAEAFTKLQKSPARSILFLAVSGEEKGLLGSRWFTEHPTVPLENVVADINMDMIGRNAPDSIVAVGMKYTSLGPLARRLAAEHPALGLTVSEDIWPRQRFFFRSDHFNFARREIPAIFFFAGVHEDYHEPSDEVAEINESKAARVARLIFYLAHATAASDQPPRWTEDGLAEVRRMTR